VFVVAARGPVQRDVRQRTPTPTGAMPEQRGNATGGRAVRRARETGGRATVPDQRAVCGQTLDGGGGGGGGCRGGDDDGDGVRRREVASRR